jgi:hypothetical protein
MSLLVRKRVLGQLGEMHHESELALRVEQGQAPYMTRVRPHGTDEPVSVRFSGRAAVKSPSQMFEGAAEIVVTRLRLLLLVKSGMNARGLSQEAGEVAIVSVGRADLGPPQRVCSRSGKIKRVEFAGSTDSFVIRVLYLRNFENFLEAMAPEYAQQLGHERAVELNQAKHLADAQASESVKPTKAEQKRISASQPSDSDQQSSPLVAAGDRLIVKLMDSSVGRLSLIGACAIIGTALILLGNYTQSYYSAEQAHCSALVRQPASCIFGSLATTIGSSLAKTGWVVILAPVVIVITAIIIVKRRRTRAAPARSKTDLGPRARKRSEPRHASEKHR